MDTDSCEQIITNDHPGFWPFCKLLAYSVWAQGGRRCGHSLDTSTKILNAIPGVDLEGSLAWLRSQGGHCDCKVLLYVAYYYEQMAHIEATEAARGANENDLSFV